MRAVIFHVDPAPGEREDDMSIAARMRRLLDMVPGFRSAERFESLTTPGRRLSLSFFADEAGVAARRQMPDHRAAHGCPVRVRP